MSMLIYFLAPAALLAFVVVFTRRLLGEEIVYEYQKGLLYKDGRLERVLEAGHYRFLKSRSRVDVYDMRPTLFVVPGQNILTKDNTNVKITMSGLYEIADASTFARQSENALAELYDIAQMALRDLVAETPIDELLEKKTEIDARLIAVAAAKAERLGVKLTTLAVRDIILPANLKKAFGAILEAQKEAQRQLEAARGEQAVLRSLANSAKMYENNPALLQARLIQALSSGRNTIIFNGDEKSLAVAAGNSPQ
jgi:regulator of protease activity HflC (stomatin/prohibitin superfamily)